MVAWLETMRAALISKLPVYSASGACSANMGRSESAGGHASLLLTLTQVPRRRLSPECLQRKLNRDCDRDSQVCRRRRRRGLLVTWSREVCRRLRCYRFGSSA